MMLSTTSHTESLPEDLIYDIIIDLVAEYLHFALITPEPGAWNAFIVLPQVSRLFHSLIQPLFRKIFGEADQISVDLVTRKRRFGTSKALWAKTLIEPCPSWDPEAENFSPDEIPRPYKELSAPNVLAVYDLASRGRYFFKTQAMHIESEEPLCCLRLWYPYMGQAMRMCDPLYPRRLLSFVGQHVAQQTTYCYSLECVNSVKSALETLLKPPEFVDTESYVSQNLESLKSLEENRWRFLWLGGFVSETYFMRITPTREMLESANILETLRAVAAHEWVDQELNIKSRADHLYHLYTSRIEDS